MKSTRNHSWNGRRVLNERPPATNPSSSADARSDGSSTASGDHASICSINFLFAFPDVSPGTYVLTGIAENHIAGVVRATVKPLTTTALDTTFVDIAMMPTGKFYGTVTLENATNHQSTVVYVDGSSYVAVTNAAGGYVIEGVPVGSWTVRGTHPGYLDRSVNGSIAAAGDSILLTSFQLPEWKERGAGGRNIQFCLADSVMHAHISEFGIGKYKKAHRHGAGAHIFCVTGKGYSLLWREGELYGLRGTMFCVWFLAAGALQAFAASPGWWATGVAAQTLLAIVLLLKRQIDRIY